MKTMRAFVIPRPQAGTFILADVAVPQIGPNEILVRTRAIGVGIHDSYFLPRQMDYPYPIGIEGAGTIERVGATVRGLQVGDRVAYVSMMQPKGGVWAEYAVVSTDSLIVPLPDGLSFEEAAAVPVAGSTTLRALHALPPIGPGGSIFVAGASGAIGTFGLQLATRRGWDVAASASPTNHHYLRTLGADLTVDYRDSSWPEEVRRWRPGGVDGALAVQPQTSDSSARVVRSGGTVVTVSGDQSAPPGVRVTGLAYHIDVREELASLMQDIVAGEIRLVIEKVYPFADALSALAKTQTRHARGKVVITLDQ